MKIFLIILGIFIGLGVNLVDGGYRIKGSDRYEIIAETFKPVVHYHCIDDELYAQFGDTVVMTKVYHSGGGVRGCE